MLGGTRYNHHGGVVNSSMNSVKKKEKKKIKALMEDVILHSLKGKHRNKNTDRTLVSCRGHLADRGGGGGHWRME